jgi:hypothetical protein
MTIPTLPLAIPIPDSYWVMPGRLLAGEYPGHKDEAQALPRTSLWEMWLLAK